MIENHFKSQKHRAHLFLFWTFLFVLEISRLIVRLFFNFVTNGNSMQRRRRSYVKSNLNILHILHNESFEMRFFVRLNLCK